MIYLAKKLHSKPCLLCGSEILAGDKVKGWSWYDWEDSGGQFGGYTRVHWTCSHEYDKLGDDEWYYRGFEDYDEQHDETEDGSHGYPTATAAAARLHEWRSNYADAMTAAYYAERARQLLDALKPMALVGVTLHGGEDVHQPVLACISRSIGGVVSTATITKAQCREAASFFADLKPVQESP